MSNDKIVKKLNRDNGWTEDDELTELRRMKRSGEYYYPLPNGGRINCASEEEYEEIKRTAKPYVDAQEIIPDHSWNDVIQYLTNCLNYYVTNKTLTQLRREATKITDEETKRKYDEDKLPIVSELIKQSDRLQKVISMQRSKLDYLKNSQREESENLADFIEKTKEETVNYANDHRGEYQWMTTCPDVKCRHFKYPFVVLQQAPHFAFDFAASPYLIWNEDVFQLTRKYYTPEAEWDDKLREYDSKGLSFKDAAMILRISPIGWLAAIYEKQEDQLVYFPLPLGKIINDKNLLSDLIQDTEEAKMIASNDV